MSDEHTIEITDEALASILAIRQQEPGDDELGLFIEVTGIRGTQFAYELSFVPVVDADPHDRVERYGDLPILIRTSDVEKLAGAHLHVSEDPSAPGLTMNNPNTPHSPRIDAEVGELTGPLAEQVQQVLASQVNPAIAGHGGAAELVGVEEGTAFLRWMGGCQGCGMAQVTLKQGIEQILLGAIPELVAVVDVTDHASGENPYYQSAKK